MLIILINIIFCAFRNNALSCIVCHGTAIEMAVSYKPNETDKITSQVTKKSGILGCVRQNHRYHNANDIY